MDLAQNIRYVQELPHLCFYSVSIYVKYKYVFENVEQSRPWAENKLGSSE